MLNPPLQTFTSAWLIDWLYTWLLCHQLQSPKHHKSLLMSIIPLNTINSFCFKRKKIAMPLTFGPSDFRDGRRWSRDVAAGKANFWKSHSLPHSSFPLWGQAEEQAEMQPIILKVFISPHLCVHPQIVQDEGLLWSMLLWSAYSCCS